MVLSREDTGVSGVVVSVAVFKYCGSDGEMVVVVVVVSYREKAGDAGVVLLVAALRRQCGIDSEVVLWWWLLWCYIGRMLVVLRR